MKPLQVEFAVRRRNWLPAIRAFSVIAVLFALQQAWLAISAESEIRAAAMALSTVDAPPIASAPMVAPALPIASHFADDANRWARIAEFDLASPLVQLELSRLVGARVIALNVDAAVGRVEVEFSVNQEIAAVQLVESLNRNSASRNSPWKLDSFSATEVERPGRARISWRQDRVSL